MTMKKRKLALHWKIIIALVLGILWSMLAGGFFGGMQQSKLENFTVNIESDSSGNETLFVSGVISYDQDDPSGLKFFHSDGKPIVSKEQGWSGNKKVKKAVSYVLGVETAINPEEIYYSHKGSFMNGITNFTADWVSPWGDIFIRLLKFIAIPLVLFSIIVGVSSLSDMSKLGRVGGKTIGTYLVTTVLAVSLGLVLVNIFTPGKGLDQHELNKYRIDYELWAAENDKEVYGDQNLVEDQSLKSLVAQVRSERKSNPVDVSEFEKKKSGSTGKGPLNALVEMIPSNIVGSLGEAKMLQVIFFAIFFGLVMAMLPADRMKGVNSFVSGANDIFIKMVDIIMKAAPFFVFCLMAGLMTKMAGTPQEMAGIFFLLGKFTLTVLAGLFVMIFIVYPLFMMLIAGRKVTYLGFFKRISPAQFLAFSTSSSAATLPVTIECVEDRIGVDNKIASFVLPIGATVNMDGTSLYQAVAAIFLAQMHGIELTVGMQVTIMAMATLASIGSAAVPSAGLVMLMIVLESVNLNPAWIVIIFPIDRLLDMCRTVVNVTGDATVATIIAKSENELNVPDIDSVE